MKFKMIILATSAAMFLLPLASISADQAQPFYQQYYQPTYQPNSNQPYPACDPGYAYVESNQTTNFAPAIALGVAAVVVLVAFSCGGGGHHGSKPSGVHAH